jgi:putative acetyltransferase
MIDGLAIRDELPSDAEHIEAIHVLAFGGLRECHVVRAFRQSVGYRADRSFVASVHGIGIVGHLLTSPVGLEGADGLVRPITVFGPLAVDPKFHGRGVGGALLRRAISYYEDQRQPILVLRGDLDYYRRFGFTPSVESDVHPPFSAASDRYLARQLSAYDARYRGTVRYPPTFAAVGYPPQWDYESPHF